VVAFAFASLAGAFSAGAPVAEAFLPGAVVAEGFMDGASLTGALLAERFWAVVDRRKNPLA
jgi:hypothetical protein